MNVLLTDNDKFCCDVLRARVADGSLDGTVLQKDVRELTENDLGPFNQVHLFAGIGGFALAQRWSGWPDDWSLVTGGPPCQPTSVAGAQRGEADPRYLWPEMGRLVEERQPDFVLYENPTGTPELAIDRVLVDLEGQGYEVGAYVLPACAVNAPHRRDRIWIVADATRKRRGKTRNDSQRHSERSAGCGETLAHTNGTRLSQWNECESIGEEERAPTRRQPERTSSENGWDQWDVEPDVGRVAHGIPKRVDRLRALGNAIVPQVATAVMQAIVRAAE